MKATIVTALISLLIASTSQAVCMKQFSNGVGRNDTKSVFKPGTQKEQIAPTANVARKK